MTTVMIALAGGLGALARMEFGAQMRSRGHDAWATRMVNVIGAATLAVVVASPLAGGEAQILTIGLLGGFTTFSTWMVEATEQRGRAMVIEVLLPLLLGLSVVAAVVGWQ